MFPSQVTMFLLFSPIQYWLPMPLLNLIGLTSHLTIQSKNICWEQAAHMRLPGVAPAQLLVQIRVAHVGLSGTGGKGRVCGSLCHSSCPLPSLNHPPPTLFSLSLPFPFLLRIASPLLLGNLPLLCPVGLPTDLHASGHLCLATGSAPP